MLYKRALMEVQKEVKEKEQFTLRRLRGTSKKIIIPSLILLFFLCYLKQELEQYMLE